MPILGSFYSFALMICPPGFARHKKLDAAAKAIIAVILLFIVLAVIFIVAVSQQAERRLREAQKPNPGPGLLISPRGY